LTIVRPGLDDGACSRQTCFFGESALVTNDVTNAFVRAKTKMTVYVLTKTDLEEVWGQFAGMEELLKSADGPRRQQRLDVMAAMEEGKELEPEEGNLLAMMEELGREPEMEVMAGYTLFPVRQHSIPQAEPEALLGVGPMNICVFEPASREPAVSILESVHID
jgi:CRP-like cAMP-binding protein